MRVQVQHMGLGWGRAAARPRTAVVDGLQLAQDLRPERAQVQRVRPPALPLGQQAADVRVAGVHAADRRAGRRQPRRGCLRRGLPRHAGGVSARGPRARRRAQRARPPRRRRGADQFRRAEPAGAVAVAAARRLCAARSSERGAPKSRVGGTAGFKPERPPTGGLLSLPLRAVQSAKCHW